MNQDKVFGRIYQAKQYSLEKKKNHLIFLHKRLLLGLELLQYYIFLTNYTSPARFQTIILSLHK